MAIASCPGGLVPVSEMTGDSIRRYSFAAHAHGRECGRRTAMPDAAMYQAIEKLRDGRCAVIRAFRPEDRAGLTAAVERASADTLYRRFFTVKRRFSQKEIDFFMNVDFVEHVALVAVVKEGGQPVIVGAGRYVVVAPGKAELAFAVIDQYQGQGIGAALMRH